MGLPVLNRVWYSRVATVTKIKSSLYSRYYAEACNECGNHLRGWTTQLRRNVAGVASHRRHCADLTEPAFEAKTSRTDSVCAKQLSYRPVFNQFGNNTKHIPLTSRPVGIIETRLIRYLPVLHI